MSTPRVARCFSISLIIALLIVAPAIAMTACFASPAAADTGVQVQKALNYLKDKQLSDGGFAEAGPTSSDQVTTWATAAIKSAGEDPASWKKDGKSPLDFLQARINTWTKLTDIERGCLAIASAGADPRSFGGRNLVAEIGAKMAADGHIGDMVNEHCWALIALKAASEAIPDSSRAWLAARQNVDGGFGFSQGVSSDPDDTGATLQALAAAGESQSSSTVTRALNYLKFCQAEDGGFCWQSTFSNVASTAWATQGIAAVGGDPGSDAWKKKGKTPLDYLGSMQQSDGHIKYKKDSDALPVWMTVEAIPALLKQPFPPVSKKASSTTPQQTTPSPPASTTPSSSSSSTQTTNPSAGSSSSPGNTGGLTGTSPQGTKQTSPSTDNGTPEVANQSNGKRNFVRAEKNKHTGLVVLILCGTALVFVGGTFYVVRQIRM